MSRDRAKSRARRATVERKTGETEITLSVDLDDPSDVRIASGVGFFDHMLDALARHGRLGLVVEAKGDLHIDGHHTVEDIGIALGLAVRRALGDDLRIGRFASAYAPLDESLARAVIDVSGRGSLAFEASFTREQVGDLDTELVEEFFRAFTSNARLTLHLDLLRGTNAHHQIEAMFKATALALRDALRRDGDLAAVPSTKGTLSEDAASGSSGEGAGA